MTEIKKVSKGNTAGKMSDEYIISSRRINNGGLTSSWDHIALKDAMAKRALGTHSTAMGREKVDGAIIESLYLFPLKKKAEFVM